MIPVTVLTGFLGSGKTTLLGRLLKDPGMCRTAVIINEFGDIALDHDLVEASDESFVQVSNGCLCCRVRSDLVLTLGILAQRRSAGTVPAFDRVVIETTGLADPAPIIHALTTDLRLAETYRLDTVVTVVDTTTAMSTLDRFSEAQRQVAVADRIVLTKTDVGGSDATHLVERLTALNPVAPILTASHGRLDFTELFGPVARSFQSSAPYPRAGIPPSSEQRFRHRELTDRLCAVTVTRDEPMRGVTLALFLSALASNCGARLLRMKGIVDIAESPERPAVIHGVQHVYHAPLFLERWPSADRRTRIVLIGEHLRATWVSTLIDLLDNEVAIEEAHVRRGRFASESLRVEFDGRGG